MSGTPRIAVISTVHDTFDTRIFYKQAHSLRQYFDVTYLSPYAGKPEEDWIVPLHKPRSRLGRIRTHLSLLSRIRRLKADLYLLHDPELLPLGILLACLGRKVVWDMHEDTYNDIRTKTYLPRPARRAVAAVYLSIQSLAFRVISGFILAEDAYGTYFNSMEKTCVVKNYPMLNRLAEHAREPVLADTIVYIGSISPNRGVFQLIEIVTRLKAHLPTVRLRLIGPFTSEALRLEVEALVRDRGLRDNVELLGPIRNLEAYPLLAECAVGVALLLPEPNFTKSLPTKMFEYMALGLPVVVSDFPLWRDIVNNHRAGIAVDSTNADAAADALQTILLDHDVRAELSRNAKMAASHYSWETESHKLRDFLSHILAS